jgi:hypothetical protein
MDFGISNSELLAMAFSEAGIPYYRIAVGKDIEYSPEATAQQTALGDALFAGFKQLAVSATKPTITADSIDETVITCGLNDFDYSIWRNILDNNTPTSGSVTDGTLELSASQAGTYTIRLFDPETKQSGYIDIEVV